MSITLRPQPIGYFAFPAGMLLLPPALNGDAALAHLLAGRVPAALPAEWAFWGKALEGDSATALELLGHDASPIGLYNRYVLSGAPDILELILASDDTAIHELAALVAYTLGQRDQLATPSHLDHELLAVASMTAAAASLEREDQIGATHHLTAAIEAARQSSPVLAAHLLSQRAQIGGTPREDYEAALALAPHCDIPGFISHLHLGLATTLHETSGGARGQLELATQHYQNAIRQGFTLEANPEMYAWTQQQLALAYLAMPLRAATDQLRMGIAIQGLREALRVYTRETHPDLWATTTLNLANALQYLPSSHTKENLIQAVNLYEELLAVRQRAFDPIGYARLLFNQSNALAHLGIFGPALEKLTEAHKLFHWHNEPLLAAQALEQAERINLQMSPVAAGAQS
jgi:tetratricopeptide (TPR) repeat protein